MTVQILVEMLMFWENQNPYSKIVVLASESWREAWQTSPREPGAISGQSQSWKSPR